MHFPVYLSVFLFLGYHSSLLSSAVSVSPLRHGGGAAAAAAASRTCDNLGDMSFDDVFTPPALPYSPPSSNLGRAFSDVSSWTIREEGDEEEADDDERTTSAVSHTVSDKPLELDIFVYKRTAPKFLLGRKRFSIKNFSFKPSDRNFKNFRNRIFLQAMKMNRAFREQTGKPAPFIEQASAKEFCTAFGKNEPMEVTDIEGVVISLLFEKDDAEEDGTNNYEHLSSAALPDDWQNLILAKIAKSCDCQILVYLP